jgi:hypothetical protein
LNGAVVSQRKLQHYVALRPTPIPAATAGIEPLRILKQENSELKQEVGVLKQGRSASSRCKDVVGDRS